MLTAPAIDLVVIIGIGALLFDVPFNGSALLLALGAVLFLFVTLGLGVLISSVSENQGQAMQLTHRLPKLPDPPTLSATG